MWSAPVTIAGPLAEPVSLAQAKAFVSVDAEETTFDGQLGAFVMAAREQLEVVTGVRVAPVTLELGARCWGDLARLPVGPVTAVTGIVWDDTAGTAQVLDPAAYELCGAGLSRGIRRKVGASWPGGVRPVEGAIRVTVEAGFEPIPGPLWTAILLMVGDLFAHRETAVVGTVSAKVLTSMQVDHLIANYRIWA